MISVIKQLFSKPKIFIDCGAHIGESIVMARQVYGRKTRIYSFEALPLLARQLQDLYANDPLVTVQNKAVCTTNNSVPIYVSTEFSDGSSLYSEKKTGGVSKDVYIDVPGIDISQWILDTFSTDDEIVLKLDIEGAEYDVLEKMIADGSIHKVSVLCGEWHDEKIDHPDIAKKAARIREYLQRHNITFHIWEIVDLSQVKGPLAKRPADMADVLVNQKVDR